MATGLLFTVTNPDASVIELNPTEYRADWPLGGHQSLSFKCYDGQLIDERARINVHKSGQTMPVFCGFFDRIKRPSFKSGLPQQYHCSGFSKLLNYRHAFQKNYASTVTVDEMLGDDVTTQGLLFQASSLSSGWEVSYYEGSPAGTYCMRQAGTNALYIPRIPAADPVIYLGATLLTKAASLAGMAINQWFRDTERLYVRTGVAAPEGDPQNYPCYIIGWKNNHLKAGILSEDNLIDPGMDVPNERIWTTFARLYDNQGLEFRFTNRADGDQNLDAAMGRLYNGWYDSPAKTYVEADLIDFETGTMDDTKFGFDSIILRGSASIIDYTLYAPKRWGRLKALGQDDPLAGGIYKEFVPYRTNMADTQLEFRAQTTISQIGDERYLKIWVLPDWTLMAGDFVRVTITSEPYDGQYNMRILGKAFEYNRLGGDVMELTLFDGMIEEI
jgi:hypothetical protein